MKNKGKEHRIKYLQDYRDSNKENIKVYNKKHNDENKDYYRDRHLKNTYNITLEEYNKLFIEQEGKCAICGIHQNELKFKLAVDHNHYTKKIRGLLCQKCNLALGGTNDSIDILLNMICYLKKEIEALDLQEKMNKKNIENVTKDK